MEPNQTPTAPLTLLEAVNTLLRAIGSTEVSSLAAVSMDQRAQGALQVIGEQSRIVQEDGWHFNTEIDYPLTPDTEGFIKVPLNTHAFKLAEKSRDMQVVLRGQRLYDLKARSYVFTKTLYADFIVILDFAEIPAPVRWYVVCKAGRVFGVGRKPDANTYRFTQVDEEMALSRALQHDNESRDVTLPETNGHFRRMRQR